MNTKIIAISIVAILVVGGVGAYFALKKNGSSEETVYPMDQLQIFGNANGDWKIDQNDANYIQDIIDGKKEKTVFADANKDGKIDEKDVEQVQKIISRNGLEYIWLVDGNNTVKKIKTTINKIGAEYFSNTELMLILGLKDKVHTVDYAPFQSKDVYFGDAASRIVTMGDMNKPNYENIVKMKLDILLTFSYHNADVKQEKLGNTDVLYLGMYRPNLESPEQSEYFQGIIKAGYIFNKVDRAEAYKAWLLEKREEIKNAVDKIPDANRKKVLMTNYTGTFMQDGETKSISTYTSIDPQAQACMLAGGKPTARDVLQESAWNGGPDRTLYGTKINIESFMDNKPDFIFCHLVRHTFGGSEIAVCPPHGLAVDDDAKMVESQAAAVANAGKFGLGDSKIYLMAGDFRNGATGGVLHAAYIATIINEGYEMPNPFEMHQEYITDWLGLEGYDLNSKGVFTCPNLQ